MEVFLIVTMLLAGDDRNLGHTEPMKDLDSCWKEALRRSTELMSSANTLNLKRIRVGCEIRPTSPI